MKTRDRVFPYVVIGYEILGGVEPRKRYANDPHVWHRYLAALDESFEALPGAESVEGPFITGVYVVKFDEEGLTHEEAVRRVVAAAQKVERRFYRAE